MKKYRCKLGIIFTLLAFISCVDNEPEVLFEDVPSARIEQQITEVKQLLLDADQGWKVTYFTDDTTLGGFTYLIKFIDEENVEMDSDFGETKGTITSSKWDVTSGSTVKLSFSTKNKIHELSDAANVPDAGLTGQGYRGSFEFLYYGKDETGNLNFRANKEFNEVVFTKATQDDWVDLSKNDDIINLLSGELSYQNNGTTFSFNFNNARRFATNNNTQITDTNFGIGFTTNGIIVSPAIIDTNEIAHSEFVLNDSQSAFVSTNGNFGISIIGIPFNINQTWLISIEQNEVSTLLFNTFVDAFNENTTIYSETLWGNIFLGDVTLGDDSATGLMFYSFSDTTTGDGFFAQYLLSFSGVSGNSNLLDIIKVGGGFNWSFYTHLNPVLNLISENAPYNTELTPESNPTTVKLTSVDNSDVWFMLRLDN